MINKIFKMKNISILQKNKVFCFSSLLLTTSIVYPLTSCGSDGSVNDIGGFDKEFGFDVQTYNRLENEFINKYRNQLLNNSNIDKNIAFDKYDNFLQNDITSIRNQLFDPAKNYSFTVKTNTLMDYASKNYNIYLNRNSDVSEIAFENLKQSSLENFVIYLDNVYGIDNKDEKIANFSKTFNELLKKYGEQYTDNAQILMKLRAGVIDCWQDLNKEFALISASNHLKDFFDDYQFIVKNQSGKQTNNNELLWDNLLVNEQFITNNNTNQIDQDIDCAISDKWINMLFTISKKKKYSENDSTNQQSESTSDILPGYKEINVFNSQEIIPGYSLTPVLKTMSQNIYANEYYMSIDWQLISNKYKDETDQEIKNKVTAHLDFDKDEQFSSYDCQFTKYSLLATPTWQKQNLSKAYFDSKKEKNQKITFSWDKKIIGIDSFLPSNAYNKDFVLPTEPYDLTIAQNNLSAMGLQLNGTNLSTLIKNIQKNTQSNNENNNVDDDLKIEDKFVKYCTIDAVSTVKFIKAGNNNNIQNTFTATFNNANQEWKVIEKQKEAELNNVGTTSAFNDKAVTFYKNVADYVNTQKIEDEAIWSDNISNKIQIELIAILCIVVIWIISIIHRIANKESDLNLEASDMKYKISRPITVLVIFIILLITVTMIWSQYVYQPIHKNLDEIKNWNQSFANGLANKINVVKKVNDDSKYFKSSDDFDKHFRNDGANAFTSYFYYCHFNGFLSETDKTTTNINDEIKKDYKQFNDTKEKFIKTGPEYKNWSYVFLVLFGACIIFMIVFIFVIVYDTYHVKNQMDSINAFGVTLTNTLNNNGDTFKL